MNLRSSLRRARPGAVFVAAALAVTALATFLPLSSVSAVLAPPTNVTAGKEFACAMAPDNSIVCWGSDSDDQLAAPPGSFIDVAAGRYHACALAPTHSIECWGSNLAPFAPYLTDQAVPPPGATFAAVTAGAFFTCALGLDGSITCWGADTYVAGAQSGRTH